MKKQIDYNLAWFALVQIIMIILKRTGRILWGWPFVFIPTYIVLLTAAVFGFIVWREKSMGRKIYKAEVRYRTDIFK